MSMFKMGSFIRMDGLLRITSMTIIDQVGTLGLMRNFPYKGDVFTNTWHPSHIWCRVWLKVYLCILPSTFDNNHIYSFCFSVLDTNGLRGTPIQNTIDLSKKLLEEFIGDSQLFIQGD